MKQKVHSMKWPAYYLLLFFLIFLYGINIYSLTAADSSPPMWDEAVHLRDSLVYYNILGNPSQINLEVIKDIINKSEQFPLLRPSGYYPPLAPILTSSLYFIFGTSAKVAIMSNLIFLLILVFSVYKTGSFIFDRSTGLLASVIILFFPLVLGHSLIYYMDLPLTAMVALSVFVILKSDYFKNTKFSILSGICFGLGMLTKWTFLFFLLGPLCYSVIKGFSSENSGENSLRTPFYSSKSSRNVILFIIISILTFGPYYFPILADLIKETFKYSQGYLAHGPDSLLSFASILFYPAALWQYMITPFCFVLFFIGIILLCLSKNNYKTFLLIWIIIPYVIFTFIIQNKTPRYMMPWLAPISLVISFGIVRIGSIKILNNRIKLKKYVIVLFLAILGFLFFEENSQLRNSILNSSREDWKINDMVSMLEEDISNNMKPDNSNTTPVYIGVIPSHHYVNGQTIRYYAALRQIPVNVIKLTQYQDKSVEEFMRNFDRYDYILTKDSSNSAISSFQVCVDYMHKIFYSRIDNFDHLGSFYEPDGSEVSIFRRKR